MLWQFYIIFILVWVGISRWRKRKLINLSKHLRSEVPCLPIVGHAYKFFGNDEVQMQGYQQFGREAIQHGGLTSVWIGYFLGVFVGDPIDAEFILKNYMDKGALMAIVRSAIGNGSVFAPVSIWRPRRKILAPTFSLKNVQNFSKVFTRQTAVMVEQLRSKVGSGPFSIWNYFTTYTTDTACGKYFHSGEIFLGIDLKSQQEGGHPFLRHFEINKVLMATRLNSPWLHSDFIYKLLPSYRTLERSKKYIYTFIEDIIRLRRKEIYATASSKKSCSSDFLEMLIELSGNDSGYTVEELREEILVAIIAGSDTSAVASSFTTLMLARHPDVQEKVYQELKEVIGDSAGPVTQADIPHLKYLEAVIKETIRLYPPSPVFLRESDRDLTLPSGTTIVKGCVLVLNTWAMHRNPKYWGPDAEEFRPERWLDTPFKHPAQFMAFSYGPRNCLGYQFAITSLKINLASLLLRYRILPDRPATGDGSRLHKPLKLKFNITMKDVDNFIVQLENRI